jgi:hypothetical protein
VAGTLSTPPDGAEVLRYRADLAEARRFTAARALRAGLPPGRADDLVIVVAELAANTLGSYQRAGNADDMGHR